MNKIRVFALLLIVFGGGIRAEYVTRTISVGTTPQALAVNPQTNRIYVANYGTNYVSVIDGATNTATNVTVGSGPSALAVNPVTNRIYAGNNGDSTVTVIDGVTHATTPVRTARGPDAIAVNPVTNRIYVTNYLAKSVTVIDGASSSPIITLPMSYAPVGIAVNALTDKIYVGGANGSQVMVIDGATNGTTMISVGGMPYAPAVNPATNKIYVPNWGGYVTVIDGATNGTTNVSTGAGCYTACVNAATNRIYALNRNARTVTVINGADNSTTTVAVDSNPNAICVNPVTNRIYVANQTRYSVTIIDGATNGTSTVAVGNNPTALAANPVTGKIYVANRFANTISVIEGANIGTATVSAGTGPYASVVNPVTNRIYIANENSGNVTVIDGATNGATNVPVGVFPYGLAVNPVTNKVYVCDGAAGNVVVLDGATSDTHPIRSGVDPRAAAVNMATNRIYVVNYQDSSLTVVDGATNGTTMVRVGSGPNDVAVNPVTNRIYTANYGAGTVTVVDGLTLATTTVPAGTNPFAIAVNPVTNRIYAVNWGSNNVTVIDGATNGTTTVNVGNLPTSVAVNVVTNRIYVGNLGSSTVTVIDGATNGTTTVSTGGGPDWVAVDPVRNRIFVTNNGSGNVTIIDGATNTTATVAAGTYPRAAAVNPVTGRAYAANYGSNTVTVIADGSGNDTKVRAVLNRLPGDTTSLGRPAITGRGVSRHVPNRTTMMMVLNRLNTAQQAWDTARITARAGTDSVDWACTWGADSLIPGQNLVCAMPLDFDAATTNDPGKGSPYAGNLVVYPVYRMVRAGADVGVTRLLAPAGTFDSGSVATPACSIANFGANSQSFNVRLKIGTSYNATSAVTGLAPGAAIALTFPNWTALNRGVNAMSCSTELNGDQQPANDRQTGSITVEVHDVGATVITAPAGIVDSGSTLTPACSVANFGSVAQSFTVRLKISAGYSATAAISGLAAGARAGVAFPNWTALTRGLNPVICSTELSGDMAAANDKRTGSVSVAVHDVAVLEIIDPATLIPPGNVLPKARLHNYGSAREGLTVTLAINAAVPYASTLNLSGGLPVGADTVVEFASWAAVSGAYVARCSTHLSGDQLPVNDTLARAFRVGAVDVGVVNIRYPTGSVDSSLTITPVAVVMNYGEMNATFQAFFRIDSAGLSIFSDNLTITDLAPGNFLVVNFREWLKPHSPGTYTARCSTAITGDGNHANDILDSAFTITFVASETGWVRKADVPAGPRSKHVKDGGALAFDDRSYPSNTSSVYALKGNNRCEFYAYNIETNTWETRDSIPAIGTSGKKKPVKKGSALTAADGIVYGFKGNNSLEFWSYEPGYWSHLADVPTGTKNLKEGAGAVTIEVGDTTCVYLLKGSGTREFFRYNITANTWESRADAPLGVSGKTYKNGSALASDGTSTIWVLKGSYNELAAYDVATGVWTTRTSLPLIGSGGRKKKVKDGAGLAHHDGYVYALKGGNTNEFWQYEEDSDQWQQSADIPAGTGRNVKGGGALVSAGNALYALKGNNTLDFFRYGIAALSSDREHVSGVQNHSSFVTRQASLAVSPNPFSSGTAISYSLPRSGDVSLSLYDVAGKRMATLVRAHQTAGNHVILLSHWESAIGLSRLARGVYLLKLETGSSSLTRKLIVE